MPPNLCIFPEWVLSVIGLCAHMNGENWIICIILYSPGRKTSQSFKTYAQENSFINREMSPGFLYTWQVLYFYDFWGNIWLDVSSNGPDAWCYAIWIYERMRTPFLPSKQQKSPPKHANRRLEERKTLILRKRFKKIAYPVSLCAHTRS